MEFLANTIYVVGMTLWCIFMAVIVVSIVAGVSYLISLVF